MNTTSVPADVNDAAEPTAVSTVEAPRRRTVWTVLSGVLGAVVGLVPHVLHHIGPLVGTALVAGSGGTALFGVLGFMATVPMLIKLQRRFSSWWAPAIAVSVFAASFAISTVLVGPLISGRDDSVVPWVSQVEHGTHHP